MDEEIDILFVGETSDAASSHRSPFFPILNSGQRIVTLCPCLPGVTEGLPRETFTFSKRGLRSVRIHWLGLLGDNLTFGLPSMPIVGMGLGLLGMGTGLSVTWGM